MLLGAYSEEYSYLYRTDLYQRGYNGALLECSLSKPIIYYSVAFFIFFFSKQGGSSNNPCSETYHGTIAESEPETQNTARYFRYYNIIMFAA